MSNWLSATIGLLISLTLIMAAAWSTREHAGFRIDRWDHALRAVAILFMGTLGSATILCLALPAAAPGDILLPALFATFGFGLSICIATVFMPTHPSCRRKHLANATHQPSKAHLPAYCRGKPRR